MLIDVKQARPSDAPIVAEMVGELLHEIMAAIGWPVFGFDATATQNRAKDWMTDGKSRIWLASDRAQRTLGFVALYEAMPFMQKGPSERYPNCMCGPLLDHRALERHCWMK